MALQNIYADPNIAADGFTLTQRSRNIRQGDKLCVLTSFITIGATDNNNSVYRMFKNIDANFVPTEIRIANDPMTSLVINVGLYLSNLSLVKAPASGGDAIFLSGKNIAAGATSLAPGVAFDGMATYWASTGTFTNLDKRLFDIGGYTLAPNSSGISTPRQFDICITATTANTGSAGNLGMVIYGYMG